MLLGLEQDPCLQQKTSGTGFREACIFLIDKIPKTWGNCLMILTCLVGVCGARYRSLLIDFGGRCSFLWHTAFKMAHRFRPRKKVPATVIWAELFGGWRKFDTDGSPKNRAHLGKKETFRISRNYQFQVNHWLNFGECVGKMLALFCVSLLLNKVESNLGISGSFMIIY